MTPGDTRCRGQTSSAGPTVRERRKAILSCPRCGHESPSTGDWIEVLTDDVREWNEAVPGGAIEVRCPDCYERLTTRSPTWQ